MSDAKPDESDLSAVAKLAGIALAPQSAPNILSLLLEARTGVLEFSDGIDDNVVPAIVFRTDYR